MSTQYTLSFTLLSDATFGRGDGVAGLVDREVAHDAHGCPYLSGRAIKGLVTEECDTLLELLEKLRPDKVAIFQQARKWMFGQPGSLHEDTARLRFGDAQLPPNLRLAIMQSKMSPSDVLDALTTVHAQTAISASGAPKDYSLRNTRAVLRQTHFEAQIEAQRPLSPLESSLLAAGVLHWRRAGSLRNRGRGRLKADLLDPQGVSILKMGLGLLEVTA